MRAGETFVLDFAREDRIGLEEAVFAGGKSAAQIDAILAVAADRGGDSLSHASPFRKVRRARPRAP